MYLFTADRVSLLLRQKKSQLKLFTIISICIRSNPALDVQMVPVSVFTAAPGREEKITRLLRITC